MCDSSTELPRLCFVHIPKCAGTSITQYFRQLYGSLAFEGITTVCYQRETAETIADKRFFAGHNYQADREKLPQGTSKFVVFREPADRLISLYRYWGQICDTSDDVSVDDIMRDAFKTAKQASIMDFMDSDNPFVRQEITNGMIRQLLPRSVIDNFERNPYRLFHSVVHTLKEFDFVITQERMAITFPLMLDRLGLRQEGVAIPCENVSSRRVDIDRDKIRTKLEIVSPADFLVYDEALKTEDRLIAESSIRF